ncbi:hypothetical protein B7P43_G04535 [Cryptotermes secundus]|uniref:Uncharacterized protein n=1 Tax=Cryptotermes secundus TaxID=105785 RepID=A0A2J7QLI0_9NEOP|nr:hypothetical protein B7P43_G04535 [Cryptotermes secundus]
MERLQPFDLFHSGLSQRIIHVLRTIGNFPRHTPVCNLHPAIDYPYVFNYITKLCR